MAELDIYYSNLIYSQQNKKTKQKVHTSGKCENPVISTIRVLHSINYRLLI